MADLTGKTPGVADYTYKGILNFENSGSGITSVLQSIQDGLGNNTGIKLSTTVMQYSGIINLVNESINGLLFLNTNKDISSSNCLTYYNGSLSLLSNSNNLIVGYDTNNRMSITCNNNGLINIDAIGSTGKFYFLKSVGIGTYTFYAGAKLAVGGIFNQAFASRNITFGDGYMQWSSGSYSLWNATAEVLTISSNGGVGVGNNSPNPSVILDLNSTTKALLVPRMTNVQRDAIINKIAGMVIYSTTDNVHQGYNGTIWNNFY